MDERKLTPTELQAIEGKFPVESCATHEVVDALLEAQLAKADKAHPDREKLRESIEAILDAGDLFLEPPEDLAEFIDTKAVKQSRADQILSLFPISSDRPDTDSLRQPSPLKDVPTIATGETSPPEDYRQDRPDREKIGNVLQRMCWNLVSESVECSGEMCNKGEGSNHLCAGLSQYQGNLLSLIDLGAYPKGYHDGFWEGREAGKMEAHVEEGAIRRRGAEEIRGKIEDFTANAGAQKYKDDLLIYLFANPSNLA